MVQIQGVGSFSLSDFDAELRVAERILSETQENARQSQKLLQQSLLSALELFQHEDRLGLQRQELGLQKQAVESRLALDSIDRKVKEFALKREQTRQMALEKLGPPPLSFQPELPPEQQIGPPPPPEFGPPLPPEMQSKITQESQDQRFTEQIKGFSGVLGKLTPGETISILPEVNAITQAYLGLNALQQLPEKQQMERKKEELELRKTEKEIEETGARIETYRGGGPEEVRAQRYRSKAINAIMEDNSMSPEEKEKAISLIQESKEVLTSREAKSAVITEPIQSQTLRQSTQQAVKGAEDLIKSKVDEKVKNLPGLIDDEVEDLLQAETKPEEADYINAASLPKVIEKLENLIDFVEKEEQTPIDPDLRNRVIRRYIRPAIVRYADHRFRFVSHIDKDGLIQPDEDLKIEKMRKEILRIQELQKKYQIVITEVD